MTYPSSHHGLYSVVCRPTWLWSPHRMFHIKPRYRYYRMLFSVAKYIRFLNWSKSFVSSFVIILPGELFHVNL